MAEYLSLPFGIRVSNNEPVDGDRYIAANIAARDLLVTNARAYNGLLVYVEDVSALYILEDVTIPRWKMIDDYSLLIQYIDGSLAARDASITFLYNWDYAKDASIVSIRARYIPSASLGSEFYWDEGYLHLDASATSDASINQLFQILGTVYDSSIFISYDDNALQNISELDRILGLLAPTKPLELELKTLSNPGTFSARLESDGTLTNYITIDITPTSAVSNFYKNNDVSLISYINEVESGLIFVTSADMTGTSDQSLTISDDSDPYVGQSGKEGFWRQLSANITAAVALNPSTNAYTYALKYPDDTNDVSVRFYVDTPTSPSITSKQVDAYPGSITRYISGVPSYAVNDQVQISYTVVNPVSKFYHKDYISRETLNAGNTITVPQSGPYSEGDNIAVSGELLTFATNKYYEENGLTVTPIQITLTPYNSRILYSAGVGYLDVSGRIDTVSNESYRVLSGSGLYPVAFGGTYDSTQDLTAGAYTNELQLLNGYYGWPKGDYTGWESGPNYTVMPAATRWVTFQTDLSLFNHTSFTLQFTGDNFPPPSPSQVTADVSIFAKVVGTSPTNGWVNCNYPYDGVSNPTNDGDGAMVVTQSDEDTKRVTFGTAAKTGSLYIRVGISNITPTLHFSSITISNRL